MAKRVILRGRDRLRLRSKYILNFERHVGAYKREASFNIRSDCL